MPYFRTRENRKKKYSLSLFMLRRPITGNSVFETTKLLFIFNKMFKPCQQMCTKFDQVPFVISKRFNFLRKYKHMHTKLPKVSRIFFIIRYQGFLFRQFTVGDPCKFLSRPLCNDSRVMVGVLLRSPLLRYLN